MKWYSVELFHSRGYKASYKIGLLGLEAEGRRESMFSRPREEARWARHELYQSSDIILCTELDILLTIYVSVFSLILTTTRSCLSHGHQLSKQPVTP